MIVGFPVLVLLLVQINALRYQSAPIMWAQRTWLLIARPMARVPSAGCGRKTERAQRGRALWSTAFEGPKGAVGRVPPGPDLPDR
jgi:hypothetical protein